MKKELAHTVTPVLNGHTKLDITKIVMINGSLTKVESIAECPLQALCNTFAMH